MQEWKEERDNEVAELMSSDQRWPEKLGWKIVCNNQMAIGWL